jgi:Tfp pilus assembly PilM family ATPase
VPLEEAEEWKLAAGSDEPGIRIDWDSRELRSVVECLRVELVDELRRSFAFYRTQGQLPDAIKVRISGGSARLPGLASRIGELLGNPVTLFNPLEHFSQVSGPQFAQAFGLALRAA